MERGPEFWAAWAGPSHYDHASIHFKVSPWQTVPVKKHAEPKSVHAPGGYSFILLREYLTFANHEPDTILGHVKHSSKPT